MASLEQKIKWSRNLQESRARSVKKYQQKLATKKKTKINPQSPQRKLLNAIYSILAAELKPLHPHCEGHLPGCTKKATQIHHKKGRRNFLLIMSKYFGYLCNNCHDICTVKSKEAKEIGLSLPINSTTEYEFTAREIALMEQFGVKMPRIFKQT